MTRRRRRIGLLIAWMSLAASGATAQPLPTCPAAVPNDHDHDTTAINACLANGGTVVLEDGGLYWIDDPTPGGNAAALEITVSGTTLRGQGVGALPILRAVPALTASMLKAENVSYVRLEWLDFDGNLPNRTAGAQCSGYRGHLSNIQMWSPEGWSVHNVVSRQALCGTAFEGFGSNLSITDSDFYLNGRGIGEYAPGPDPWADGLTLWSCENGIVRNNTFADNTDINLAVGGGAGCVVEDNVIANGAKHGFAGLGVVWFPHGAGNHAGSVYRRNTITSGLDRLAFGIVVGNEPWHPAASGFVGHAGVVENNTVSGAVVNIAVVGISGGRIQNNQLSNPQGTTGFGCALPARNFTAWWFGAAVLLPPDWVPRWYYDGLCGSWNPALPTQSGTGALVRGQVVPAGEFVRSINHELHHQASDGHLVNYAVPDYTPVWWNGVFGHAPGIFTMQQDGNAVVYDASGQPVWATMTNGHAGAYLVVQGDGNVVIYGLSGEVLWASWGE